MFPNPQRMTNKWHLTFTAPWALTVDTILIRNLNCFVYRKHAPLKKREMSVLRCGWSCYDLWIYGIRRFFGFQRSSCWKMRTPCLEWLILTAVWSRKPKPLHRQKLSLWTEVVKPRGLAESEYEQNISLADLWAVDIKKNRVLSTFWNVFSRLICCMEKPCIAALDFIWSAIRNPLYHLRKGEQITRQSKWYIWVLPQYYLTATKTQNSIYGFLNY